MNISCSFAWQAYSAEPLVSGLIKLEMWMEKKSHVVSAPEQLAVFLQEGDKLKDT